MSRRSKPLTRRRYLASVSALLGGATAGCSALDASPGNTRESTATTTKRGMSTTATTEPTQMTTPTLNRTGYPSVQQRTDDDALPETTVILFDRDWRSRMSMSALGDETVSFVEETDFETRYVAGFEVQVTEWGYHLRLESVEQSADRVRIEYSDVFVEGGPNVEQWRAMFVRLPRENGVPGTVTLHRTDESE